MTPTWHRSLLQSIDRVEKTRKLKLSVSTVAFISCRIELNMMLAGGLVGREKMRLGRSEVDFNECNTYYEKEEIMWWMSAQIKMLKGKPGKVK